MWDVGRAMSIVIKGIWSNGKTVDLQFTDKSSILLISMLNPYSVKDNTLGYEPRNKSSSLFEGISYLKINR